MNLKKDCPELDGYLSGDLPADKRAVFESHMEGCPTCRDAADQQRWVDHLLYSPERLQLETPPLTILHSFRASLAQRRRQILRAACRLAIAASLLIAVGLLELNRQANLTVKTVEPSVVVAEAIHAQSPVQPVASFVSSADAIVVPLESASADVTIVQVYPTTDTERRWRLEAVLSTNL